MDALAMDDQSHCSFGACDGCHGVFRCGVSMVAMVAFVFRLRCFWLQGLGDLLRWQSGNGKLFRAFGSLCVNCGAGRNLGSDGSIVVVATESDVEGHSR